MDRPHEAGLSNPIGIPELLGFLHSLSNQLEVAGCQTVVRFMHSLSDLPEGMMKMAAGGIPAHPLRLDGRDEVMIQATGSRTTL
jgi:hypothetical protein